MKSPQPTGAKLEITESPRSLNPKAGSKEDDLQLSPRRIKPSSHQNLLSGGEIGGIAELQAQLDDLRRQRERDQKRIAEQESRLAELERTAETDRNLIKAQERFIQQIDRDRPAPEEPTQALGHWGANAGNHWSISHVTGGHVAGRSVLVTNRSPSPSAGPLGPTSPGPDAPMSVTASFAPSIKAGVVGPLSPSGPANGGLLGVALSDVEGTSKVKAQLRIARSDLTNARKEVTDLKKQNELLEERLKFFQRRAREVDRKPDPPMYQDAQPQVQSPDRGQGSSPAVAEELFKAASAGNMQQIKDLVAAGSSVDATDGDNRTALHVAAAEGGMDVVQALLQLGAKVNIIDRWNSTPVAEAMRAKHYAVVKMLRANGGKTYQELKMEGPAASSDSFIAPQVPSDDFFAAEEPTTPAGRGDSSRGRERGFSAGSLDLRQKSGKDTLSFASRVCKDLAKKDSPDALLLNAILDGACFGVNKKEKASPSEGLPPSFKPGVERIQKLLQIMSSVSTELDLEMIASDVERSICDLVHAEIATMFLMSPDSKELVSKFRSSKEGMKDVPLGRGLIGHCARRLEIFSTSCPSEDPDYMQEYDDRHGTLTRNILCAPVYDAGQRHCLGVVRVLNKIGGNFTHQDELLVCLVCNQAAVALTNGKKHTAILDVKEHVLSSAEFFARLVPNPTKPLASLGDVVNHTVKAVKAEAVGVFIVDKRVPGQLSDPLTRLSVGTLQGIIGHVFRTSQPVNVPNTASDRRFDPAADDIDETNHARSLLCAPVRRKGQVVGVLRAVNKKFHTQFSTDDRDLLSMIGCMLGAVLDNFFEDKPK